jgi:putative peptidoglycan lipid II flippase
MKLEQKRLIRSATLISALTLLSRLLGFARDLAIAYVLGASFSADAFFVAFRIPNLFRRLYAEGSLSLPYMPELTRARTHGDEARFSNLARHLGSFAVVFYLGVTLLGVAAAPLCVSLLAPGFVESEVTYQLALELTRWLFPYVFCVGVAGFVMALLNTYDHFGAPAASPSLLNLSMLGLLGIGGYFNMAPEWSLTCGVVLGGLLQIVFPYCWARPLVPGWRFTKWWRAPEIRAVLKLLVPTVVGAAVYHLNIFVATVFASFLTVGSISYLYYAERLFHLPLGLFGGAIATSVLPYLTRQNALREWSAFRRQVIESIELIWFLTIPAAVGLWVIRVPLVRLLFERGEFSETSTLMTAQALGYFALGLWAVAGLRLLVVAWYALDGAYFTVLTGVGALAVNIVLSALLVGSLGHSGLALAISVSAIVNWLTLLVLLARRLGSIEGRRLLRSGLSCMSGALVMGFVVGVFSHFTYGGGTDEGGQLLLALSAWIVVGVVVYLGVVLWLGLPEGVKTAWNAWRQG